LSLISIALASSAVGWVLFSDASSPSTNRCAAQNSSRRLFGSPAVLSSDQEKLLMAETEDSSGPKYPWSGPCSPRSQDRVDLDVSWLTSPDLSIIDVLAHLHVIACRRNRALWLHGATAELVELVDLVGLSETVHLCPCR
jgi:STAS domain